jgi:hypothetical protein
MKWKSVSLVLRVAVVLQLVLAVGYIVMFLVEPNDMTNRLRIELGIGSLEYAVQVMFAIGCFDLARRLTGRARLGAQIACYAYVCALAIDVAYSVVTTQVQLYEHQTFLTVYEYVWVAMRFVPLAGLVLAAWDRIAIAIGGLVAAVLVSRPPVVMKHVVSWLDLGDKGRRDLSIALFVLEAVALFALVLAASPDTSEIAEPHLAERGLRRAASALWLRVIAVGAVPALMLLAIMGHSEDTAKMIAYATIMAAIVNAWSFTQFAIGVLGVARARLADMSSIPLYASAIGAFANAGLVLRQTPELYRMLFSPDRGFGGEFTRDYMAVFAITAPLVAIGSLVVLAAAIAGFAGRRSGPFNDLHTEASGKGMGAGALLLVPFAIMQWMLPSAESAGSAVFMLLAIIGCSIAAIVMMARLCTLAADQITREPSLPTATVV